MNVKICLWPEINILGTTARSITTGRTGQSYRQSRLGLYYKQQRVFCKWFSGLLCEIFYDL